MSEENNNAEEIQEQAGQENAPNESPNEEARRRRVFTRRNAGIAFGAAAILLVLIAGLVTVLYRIGYFDNYIKTQFVAKMDEIGVRFDADVFEVRVSPLRLQLRNATFNDKITGEKLFRIGQADLGLSIKDLYAWQLSRDISIDTTDLKDVEAWVRFDENGKSNFSNLQLVEDASGSRVNFKYSSVKFSLQDGIVHFGDVQRKITADAKNVSLGFEPENYDVADEQKRYKVNFSSTDSQFTYDASKVEPVTIRATGIAFNEGAEISQLSLITPLGESNLSGTLTDWESPKYNLKIDSTVDLTQTSTVFPLGTSIRGVGNFSGTVTGEGDVFKVEGEVYSESLAADNIRLKAVKINAVADYNDSMYNANGKAVAEMLTFEDFVIDYPQIIGNVRGTGTDFRWVGELQAIGAKTPLGTITGLFIKDAVADYKEKQFGADFGDVRARSFVSPDVNIENLQTRNVKLSTAGGVTDVSAPGITAGSVKTDDLTLRNTTASNVRLKDSGDTTDITATSARSETLDTADGRLKNISAQDIRIRDTNGSTDINASNLQADNLDTNGAKIGNMAASGVNINIAGNETRIYSNNLKIAKITTDAAILGSLNVAGVRLTLREGRIEGTSGDINAGNVVLTKSAVPEGGNLENVKIFKPVFVLEPSGRYRASADMSIGGGVLGSVQLGSARASVVAEREQVALNNLTAQVMDGNLNGNAVIALTDRRRSTVAAQFDNLDLGKLLALTGGKVVPVEGKTTGNVDLNFPGTNIRAASGTLVADFNANAGTAERGLVPVNGKLGLNATDGLFNIDFADLFTEKSKFNATGSFDLSGNDSNLTLALNSTDASEIERIIRVLNLSPAFEQQLDNYQAKFAGNLEFTGNLTGNLSDPTLSGRAALDSLILRNRNLGSLATGIFLSPNGLELREGILREPAGGGNLTFDVNVPNGGTDNISVNAKLENINTGNLIAALPVDILPAGFQDFQAQTSGTLNLSGLPGAMEGSANISSGKGTINGEPFDGFEAKANFQGNLVNLENFTGRFGDGTLNASGTYRTDSKEFNFDVTGENVALARVRPFIPNSQNLPALTGTLDVKANATGTASDSRTYNINFSGTGSNVAVGERSVGGIVFAGKTENQRLNTNFTINFEGQPQEITATVNFADENLPFRAETVFNNTELSPIINLIRPEGVEVTGTATGNVFIAGNLSGEKPDGTRGFTTDNLSGEAQFSQFALQIEDTPLVATEPISVKFNSREVVVDNAKFSGGGTNIVVSGTKALTETGVNNLAIDGSINLRILNALSQNSFFAGITNVSVRLTGVNATARLNGSAELQNASVATFIGSERISFDRITGRLIFTSNQAQIDNLTGFMGGGRVTASGGALIGNNLQLQQFRVNVRGTNITAPLPPDFITTGDAEGEISGYREGTEMNTLIRGTFNARRSVYTKDIDVADIVSGRGGGGSLSAGSGDSSTTSIFGIPKLDIRIEGRDALVVRNNLADLTASASLRVTGDTEFPQISGRITANSGTIFFRKDRYEVQRATLEFPPNTNIEPYINLQAEAEISGYQVIVSLVGNITDTENLTATVRSNPALPQADVISLITTGNLANTDTGIPTLAQSGINTAAEILTDSFINNPASRATDKLFGLNRFELDPIISGQRLNPSARLTVGRQINRNLLVTYSTNLSEDQNQVLALEYRVSNRLSFVAQYEQRSLSNATQRNSNFNFEIRLRKRF